jgi:hypothetical protein
MNNYSFANSILEGATNAPDALAPLAFLDWFAEKKFTSSDVNYLFKVYRNYVVEWSKTKQQTKTETANLVRDSYIQVLRDVVLNYSTREEQKFVSNADFTSETDLDIVLPFFIKKIKNICLFYNREREKVKFNIEEFKIKGSARGVKGAVSKIIFDSAYLSTLGTSISNCSFPPLSALANSISVYVEELYDQTGQYFNVAPNNPQTTLLYGTLSAANINTINSLYYTDFKQAIIDAIKEYPFFVRSLGTNNFTVNPILSGTEFQYLKSRDFINYLSGGPENLKINITRLLAPKFLGNDFYYLSTGNTISNFVSGILFTTNPLTGANTLNLLNRQYASTATVPSIQDLYSEYEIGRFFLPQHTGILVYNAPSKTFSINQNSLEPNKVYAFPDPSVLGNTSYNSGVDENLSPLIYEIDVTWNKISRSNQFAFGDVLSNSYNQLFYGYQSLNQDLNRDTQGLSRSTDNIQFWTGERQDAWANPDIWPDLKTSEVYPIDQRQSSILSNELILSYWGNDKFGNDYGVYKNTIPLDRVTVENDPGVITDSFSIAASATSLVEKSIFQKKNKIPGYFFFRDNFTSIISPASASLSAVFIKYPLDVRNELSNSVVYFAMYYDTFVVETTNYVIIDSISYDFDTGSIASSFNHGTYFAKNNTASGRLERFAGEWLYEAENTLYLVFLKLLPALSASNYRAVYPAIYKTPLTNINLAQVYPDNNTNIFNIYSLSGISDTNVVPQVNLFKIDGISFSRDLRKNVHNLTYLGKNLNDMPLIVNEQLGSYGESFNTSYPVMFEPFYFIYDNNYYNPSLQYVVRYNASSSGVTGDHEPVLGNFNVGQQDSNLVTYLFNDGITPLQINKIGTYIIQFDWESYIRTSIFVGCNGYSILNVQGTIAWNGSYTSIFNGIDQTRTVAVIPLTASNSTVYTLSAIATRLTYPDASLMRLTLVTNPSGFTEDICTTPDAIYSTLEIVKGGKGNGLVFTDPYCLSCGTSSSQATNVCQDVIYNGATLTVVASADYYSEFASWNGFNCPPANACTINITNNSSITAYFNPLPIYNLEVATVGYYNNYANYTQVGKIWCNDPSILCGTKCSAPFRSNTLLTLSAQVPLSGWYFRGFDGGQCAGYTDDTCTFFIAQNQSTSATYVRVFNYNLYVTVSSVSAAVGNKYGRVVSIPTELICNENQTAFTNAFSGTGYITDVNDTVTISAQPLSGFYVARWAGNKCSIENPRVAAIPCDSTYNYCTFAMTEDATVSAFFDVGYYTLNVIASGSGFGWSTVDVPEASGFYCSNYDGAPQDSICCYQFLSGTTITLAASALDGSSVRGIYSDDCAGETLSSCTFKVDRDKTVIVKYDSGRFYNLIVQNTSKYGLVSSEPYGIACLSGTGDCLASFAAGTLVTLSATTTRTQPFQTFWGRGIVYKYIVDPSVIVTYNGVATNYVQLSSQSPFTLSDGSLVITDAVSGAPYLSGGNEGIRIGLNTTVDVLMTTNRTVSARYL